MDDILYLDEKGNVCISKTGMSIPEFKEFKKYDRKDLFDVAIAYIFYVYKIFGESKNKSYLSNLPLKQRQVYTCKNHTKGFGIEHFESNTYVKKCIDAYLLYTRTQAERLLDSFKEDVDKFITYVEHIPIEKKGIANVRVKVPDEDRWETCPVDVVIPNIDERMETIIKAQKYKENFHKWEKDVDKDRKTKNTQARIFENKEDVEKITIHNIPMASEA